MRKAVLHLGFHKTGTTFLQMATRRWVRSISPNGHSVFFSSRHMPDSGWLQVRNNHCLRLRHRIAHAPLETFPSDAGAVRAQLSQLELSREFEVLCAFFNRAETVLIHSDENSIGNTFGHPGYGSGRLWPFYPNGEWLCAIFAAAAFASYTDVHLVLSVRRFDEMLVSSIKDLVRSPRPVPAIQLFSRTLSDLSARCRRLVQRLSTLDFVSTVHLLDYELLRRSPHDYFQTFIALTGMEPAAFRVKPRAINRSRNDEWILDRLVEKGALAVETRPTLDDLKSLLGREFLDRLATDYEALLCEITAAAADGGKIRYYR